MAEIGRVEKNKNAQIVVRTSKFKGRQFVDIREHVESDNYTGFTKKGVLIRRDLLESLIALLEEAGQAPDEDEEERGNYGFRS